MGLSGRKQKQRIGHDPRNLAWADDAAKFGQQYLSKFGWDASKGLGSTGDGRTSHLKVSQKLDMLGIGHAHQNSPDGIAWKQNRDFEALLRRLNGEEKEKEGLKVDGFHRAREGSQEAEDVAGVGEKRKRVDGDDGEVDEKEAKRRRKEEKAKRKEEKAKRKAEKAAAKEEAKESSESEAEDAPKPAIIRAPPRSHRARHIRMKRLAASDSAAMSEILGVSSSSIPSTPVPVSTLTSTSIEAEHAPLEKLTTSTFSVADYFKAKLAERSTAKRPVGEPETPQDVDEKPRMGLGMRARVAEEDEASKLGLGATSKFASMAMFAPAKTETVVEKDAVMQEEIVVVKEEVVENVEEAGEEKLSKEERRKAKEARKAEKAERKRLKAEKKAAETKVIEEPTDEPTKKRKSKKDRSSKKQKESEDSA